MWIFLAGHESYDYKYQYLYGQREKLYDPNVPELGNGIMNQSIIHILVIMQQKDGCSVRNMTMMDGILFQLLSVVMLLLAFTRIIVGVTSGL